MTSTERRKRKSGSPSPPTEWTRQIQNEQTDGRRPEAVRAIRLEAVDDQSDTLPYTFARRIATADHHAKGRVGWNIVTSYLESGAKNISSKGLRRHDIHEEHILVSSLAPRTALLARLIDELASTRSATAAPKLLWPAVGA